MKNNFKKYTFYQIYLRSFQDTNGDGIGDLEGVIKRLPLISELGIDFIWLSPIYKSHQYDNGYDVDDYKSIDPVFGDFEVFDRLIKEANKLEIGIMLDMVFNHTSTHHEWFQKALAGDKKYQDYYIFKENTGDIPTNWESKFGGSAWEYVESLDKYYLHLYHKNQADLNWKNINVRDELVDVLKFWKSKGVKGFRFDVINVIDKPEIYQDDYEGDGRRFYTDGPNVLKYMQFLVENAGLYDDCVTVGELSSTTIENSAKYTNPDNKALDMAFNFHHLKVDYKNGDKWELSPMNNKSFFELLDEWQTKIQKNNGWSAWFLNNHDQPRAISRIGNDCKYHYASGSSLALLTHTMIGSPYVYQGEEIGMNNANFNSIDDFRDTESINYYNILLSRGIHKDDALNIINQRSRDNGRLPIRWDDSEYGGFSNNKAWIGYSQDKEINYIDQVKDTNSLLSFYKRLIKLRKYYNSLAFGNYDLVYLDSEIYCFKRSIKEESLVVIVSLSENVVHLDDIVKKAISKSNASVIINNYSDFNFQYLEPYQSIVIKTE